MSTQTVEKTPNKFVDTALVTLALALAVAGLIAFTFMTDRSMTVRLGTMAGCFLVAVAMAAFSPSGKQFFQFGKLSYEELRRVVWPSRKETVNTTGIVMAFVVAVACYLFLIDKLVQWGLYDGLLKMTF